MDYRRYISGSLVLSTLLTVVSCVTEGDLVALRETNAEQGKAITALEMRLERYERLEGVAGVTSASEHLGRQQSEFEERFENRFEVVIIGIENQRRIVERTRRSAADFQTTTNRNVGNVEDGTGIFEYGPAIDGLVIAVGNLREDLSNTDRGIGEDALRQQRSFALYSAVFSQYESIAWDAYESDFEETRNDATLDFATRSEHFVEHIDTYTRRMDTLELLQREIYQAWGSVGELTDNAQWGAFVEAAGDLGFEVMPAGQMFDRLRILVDDYTTNFTGDSD